MVSLCILARKKNFLGRLSEMRQWRVAMGTVTAQLTVDSPDVTHSTVTLSVKTLPRTFSWPIAKILACLTGFIECLLWVVEAAWAAGKCSFEVGGCRDGLFIKSTHYFLQRSLRSQHPHQVVRNYLQLHLQVIQRPLQASQAPALICTYPPTNIFPLKS